MPNLMTHVTEHKSGGLSQLPATAICGNDITSSCLYVSALAIMQGGKWAWQSHIGVQFKTIDDSEALLFAFSGDYSLKPKIILFITAIKK